MDVQKESVRRYSWLLPPEKLFEGGPAFWTGSPGFSFPLLCVKLATLGTLGNALETHTLGIKDKGRNRHGVRRFVIVVDAGIGVVDHPFRRAGAPKSLR